MFSSNNWIAFWFTSLVLNVVALIVFEEGRFFTVVGAVSAAWFFMAGFMEAIRPSQEAESKNSEHAAIDEQPKQHG